MVKRIGIVLPHTYDSQLAYECIKEGNYLCQTDPDYDVSIFYEDLTPNIIRPIFGVYNASEVFSYGGDLIATTLQTADAILHTMKSSRKIFYVWDLEWIRNEKNYIDNIRIYQDPRLELVCPSKEYAAEIKNYCNRSPSVIPRFRIKDIVCLTKK